MTGSTYCVIRFTIPSIMQMLTSNHWNIMIIWIATLATPQFARVLNNLDDRQPGLLHVRYLKEGSAGRDWGALELTHPHEYVHRGVRSFFDGFSLISRRGVSTLVTFGYTYSYSMGALLAARIFRKRIFTQSDSSFRQHSERPWLIRCLKLVVIRILYPKDTRVWVIGEDNAKFWGAFGLTNQSKVDFESPVATDISRSHSRIPYLLERDKNAPNTERLALYVGRLSPEKLVRDAIRAVGLARTNGTSIRLAVVGSGDTDLLTINQAKSDWTDYVGPIPHQDLGALFAEADVLVLPSKREPYGLVVREALQFGLPVVASTAVAAARELCDEGWNIVPVGDIDGLAAAITHAVQLDVRWTPVPPVDVSDFYELELVGHPETRHSP